MYINLNGYEGTVSIQLKDLAGKILKQEKLQMSTLKSAQQSMNVSGYANGIYFVTAIDEKGNRRTEKLIVQR